MKGPGITNPESGGRGRRRWPLFIFLAVLIAGGAALWRYSQRGWTVSKLEKLIRAELSPGCDRRQLESWFDRHGISCSYSTDMTADFLGGRTAPGSAGLRAEDLSGMVRGTIEGPDANVGLLTAGRITVYLFLDRQGRWVGHWIKPFAYMP